MIRFTKYIWLYALISALVLVPGIFSLVRFGLQPSIDFTGGTLIELRVANNMTQQKLETKAASDKIVFSSIQHTASGTYLLRTKDVTDQKLKVYVASLNAEATGAATVVRQESVGPTLGKELLVKAVIAALFAIVAILTYMAYAFKNVTFGVAAIVALIHDLLVVAGSFSLFGYFFHVEVDTLFVTAVLTTMSFSVHDTIVVFDRIREYQHKSAHFSFEELCDRALTETMGRSLANSVTIILMLTALVLLGGENIKWFATALLIGTISGTYSSPFIATPSLVLIRRLAERRKSA